MAKEIDSKYIFNQYELESCSKIYAGPGAGKTYFLVNNVRNIVLSNQLIKNSEVKKVLCITYTNAAADEIKRRLDKYSNFVEISTIHGFIIQNIIKPFQQSLINIMKSDFNITVSPDGKITSQQEGVGIFHGVDKEDVYDFIKFDIENHSAIDFKGYTKKKMGEVETDNVKFVQSVQNGCERVHELICPTEIDKLYKKSIKKYLWSVVRKLTHNEILYFGYRILEDNWLALQSIRAKFPFIFIDEFQDTNPLQTLMVKLIGKKHTKIIVVGDIAQSIYSFQGAKPKDFDEFSIDTAKNEFFIINGNRRSTENIVNFCNFLRKSDKNVVQTSIKVNSEGQSKNHKIHFLIGKTTYNLNLVDNIVKNGGVILTRRWVDAFNLINKIDDDQIKKLKNIYYSYSNSTIQLRDEIVSQNNISWVTAFKLIIKLWQGLNSTSLKNMTDALKIYFGIKEKDITAKVIFELNNLLIECFNSVDANTYMCEIISNFNSLILNPKYKELKDVLGDSNAEIVVFDEFNVKKIAENVSLLTWDTSLKLFNEVFSENSKYMTVHQAKGLEWDKVVISLDPIPHDCININKVFENPEIIGNDPSNEFVRMFYVACSRAREDLYILLPENIDKNKMEQSLNNYKRETNCNFEYEFYEK